ncbi:hypothetical protein AB0O28_18805 [Microbispora sp. NPDC088329]|uniref:hypothetical protein n=1 Tax=Microbispora sp. NPDC088329 TaxID=3154869 RepID=UPI003434E567
MDVVIATDTVNVTFGGQRVHIPRGTAWDAADPLVKQFPGLFSADDRHAMRTQPRREPEDAGGEPPVERATRAPGERSQARRPRTAR